MYYTRSPLLLKMLYPEALWRVKHSHKIYLTFDDGPVPEVTPWVLNELNKENIKATFFCIGNNVKKNKGIYADLLAEKHAVGNHTYNHCNGWKTSLTDYLNEVEQCSEMVQTNLFRPPYGKLKLNQYNVLKNKYKICMWNVLSADFDKNIFPEKCYHNVVSNMHAGSVIVFHDSIKAQHNLKYALPKVIETAKNKGFQFGLLS